MSSFISKILNFFRNQEEPYYIREIVIDKPIGWEHLYAAELLEYRLRAINKAYDEIQNGVIVKESKEISGKDFLDWYQNIFSFFQKHSAVFVSCIEKL